MTLPGDEAMREARVRALLAEVNRRRERTLRENEGLQRATAELRQELDALRAARRGRSGE